MFEKGYSREDHVPLQSAEVSHLLEKGNISGTASFLIEMKSKQGGYICFQFQGV